MIESRLTKREARRYLDQFVTTGSLRIADHAQRRMRKRRFGTQDARYVMASGEIKSMSYQDDFGDWKIEIVGEDLDGYELTLLVGLDLDESRVSLITGF